MSIRCSRSVSVTTALALSTFVACGPDEAASVEVARGIYEVKITAVDEGCDAPSSTQPYTSFIDLNPEGEFRLTFQYGPFSDGLAVRESHKYAPIAGQPGHYATVTNPGVMDPPCGAWKGELGEAELVDDGHLMATLTLQWTPAQACPDVPNVPTAACTSVLEYDFQLTMECPDECEFGYPSPSSDPACECP